MQLCQNRRANTAQPESHTVNTPSSTADLNSVLNALDIAEAEPILTPYWQESCTSLPADAPTFLTPDAIAQARLLARLPPQADAVLHLLAQRILASPHLLQYAWHCQRLLCEHLDYDTAMIRQWPELQSALGRDAGAFYLLVGLAAIPRIRAVHKKLAIPEAISLDTCGRHYPETVGRYRDHHDGCFGVKPGALYWLRNYIRGDLYRLGRLEYMLRPFSGRLRAFRHQNTRTVIALAADGSVFDAEGLATQPETPGAWRATLSEENKTVCGYPIAPQGYAQPQQIALALDEWQPALTPGDTILDVHIPSGGQMTLHSCRESMQQALDFFPRYFPGTHSAGFACGSWILNPQLAQIYRPDSNIVLWQRELYLYPIVSSDRSGLVFVFGKDEVDLETAPRDTSLRRALLDHMQIGGRLIGGGMFLLREDFANFGSQPYHQHWRAGNA